VGADADNSPEEVEKATPATNADSARKLAMSLRMV
jgi:hypothetical protein